MTSPLKELQRSIVLALKADASIGAQLDDRIYDRVPASPSYPYLTVRLTDTTENDDACGNHWLAAASVHVWSNAVGRVEASEILGLVRSALDGITSVTGFKLNYGQWRVDRVLDDPDGVTTHGISTFEFHLSAV